MTLVSPQQLATTLGVSVDTVYRMAQRGDLPSYKIGSALRFDLDEIPQLNPKPEPEPRPFIVGAGRLLTEDQVAALPRDGCVYFIQADCGGPIKIGTSKNLFRRLLAFQEGCPFKLHVLATMPGGQWQEIELHHRFQHDRSHGEWFHPTPELLAFIAEAKEAAA